MAERNGEREVGDRLCRIDENDSLDLDLLLTVPWWCRRREHHHALPAPLRFPPHRSIRIPARYRPRSDILRVLDPQRREKGRASLREEGRDWGGRSGGAGEEKERVKGVDLEAETARRVE